MRHLVLAFALTALFGIAEAKNTTPPAGATPITTALTPTKDQGEAGLWASRYLSRFHYKPLPLDDAMSEKIFDGYLDSLDGERLFFTQADINKFKPARD
ncbi:MAG: tail-specific protease, partial [Dokdonella sp.]